MPIAEESVPQIYRDGLFSLLILYFKTSIASLAGVPRIEYIFLGIQLN